MSILPRLLLAACAIVLATRSTPAQDAEPVRPKAVVNFSFEEDAGPAKDTATVGQTPDEGKFVNDPVRVPSPFWNQSGKKAVQLDAARQQFIEIPDSPDVDAPIAVSFGLFVVNLTEPTDAGYHGLVAKRVGNLRANAAHINIVHAAKGAEY